MDLITRLHKNTGLTPTDQCLRDYILRYPERLARMNNRELAAATFTSPAAVVRFCHKFGYQGLAEFKTEFFSALPDTPTFDLPDADFPFQKDTDTKTLIRNILTLEEGSLQRLNAILKPETLDKAASLLMHATELDLCGLGTNQYLMEDWGFRLNKFGYHVNYVDNSVALSYAANKMDDTHCLIIASYSGINEQIGSAIRIARRFKCPILLITAQANSASAKLADCILLIPPLESNDDKVSTFASAIATKAVLDLLLARLFQNDYDKNAEFVHQDAARLAKRRMSSFQEALGRDSAH